MLQATRADRIPNGPGCTLWYIAHRAALDERRSGDWICEYVQLLIDHHGFPPPLPEFVIRTGAAVKGVRLSSRWNREPVDAWFDGQVPPQLLAAVEDRRAALDAATLDRRARLAAAA